MSRRTPVLVIGMIGVLGALWCAPARAQRADDRTDDRTEDRTEARALFERADALLTRGRFAEAHELLVRSFASFATAPTAFNLAVASRGIGRSVEAVAWLDRLASAELGPLDEARLAEVRALRAEVEREIATLSLEACGGDARRSASTEKRGSASTGAGRSSAHSTRGPT